MMVPLPMMEGQMMIRQRRRWWQRQLMKYSWRNSFLCARDASQILASESHFETFAEGNTSEGKVESIFF